MGFEYSNFEMPEISSILHIECQNLIFTCHVYAQMIIEATFIDALFAFIPSGGWLGTRLLLLALGSIRYI